MSAHLTPNCPEHGPKRQEPYDDHFIFICDKCAEFFEYRQAWRHLMAEKSLSEIRASRRTFEKMAGFSKREIEQLIDDLKLLESYKSKSHCVRDEFDRIMETFHD